MALENKLGITNSAELAREEERISKTRAIELFETNFLSSLNPGTFDALSKIHHHAASREIFANGAVKAAKFIINKKHGLYCMADLVAEQ